MTFQVVWVIRIVRTLRREQISEAETRSPKKEEDAEYPPLPPAPEESLTGSPENL